jgi:hypothetical protein
MHWEYITVSYAGGLNVKLLSKWYDSILKPWVIEDKAEGKRSLDDLQLIQEAGKEVSAARSLFSQVEDPDMMDWAVYSLTAAEKRYDYLIKRYRQKKDQSS